MCCEYPCLSLLPKSVNNCILLPLISNSVVQKTSAQHAASISSTHLANSNCPSSCAVHVCLQNPLSFLATISQSLILGLCELAVVNLIDYYSCINKTPDTMSYSFRWCKRIKTDDHNRLIKTNMAVHYHISAVIQIQCPGCVQACKYTYLNKVPFKKVNLNVAL